MPFFFNWQNRNKSWNPDPPPGAEGPSNRPLPPDAVKMIKELDKYSRKYLTNRKEVIAPLLIISEAVASLWIELFNSANKASSRRRFEVAEQIILYPDILKALIILYSDSLPFVRKRVRDLIYFIIIYCSTEGVTEENDKDYLPTNFQYNKVKYNIKISEFLYHSRHQIVRFIHQAYSFPNSAFIQNDIIRIFVQDNACLSFIFEDDGVSALKEEEDEDDYETRKLKSEQMKKEIERALKSEKKRKGKKDEKSKVQPKVEIKDEPSVSKKAQKSDETTSDEQAASTSKSRTEKSAKKEHENVPEKGAKKGVSKKPLGCFWGLFKHLVPQQKNHHTCINLETYSAYFDLIEILLGGNREIVEPFLSENWKQFSNEMMQLLISTNFFLQVRAMHLLYDILININYSKLRDQWLSEPANIRIITLNMQHRRKDVRIGAISIFELFVLNPNKTEQVDKFLRSNQNLLISYFFESAPLHYYKGTSDEKIDAQFAKIVYHLFKYTDNEIEAEESRIFYEKVLEEFTVKTREIGNEESDNRKVIHTYNLNLPYRLPELRKPTIFGRQGRIVKKAQEISPELSEEASTVEDSEEKSI